MAIRNTTRNTPNAAGDKEPAAIEAVPRRTSGSRLLAVAVSPYWRIAITTIGCQLVNQCRQGVRRPNGVAELTTTILKHDEVRDLVERMLKLSGRRLDLSSPFVDANASGGRIA